MKSHRQPELIEQLSARRLSASKQSDTCPACGGVKAKGQIFCAMCIGRLTPAIAGQLHLCMDEGGDLAMLQAMKHLGAHRIIMPDDVPLENLRRVAMTHLSAEICTASIESTICPKCGYSRKPIGSALCYVCISTLSTALVGQARRRRFDGGVRFGGLMKSLTREALQLAPDEYIHALRLVFRLMRCPVFRVIFLED